MRYTIASESAVIGDLAHLLYFIRENLHDHTNYGEQAKAQPWIDSGTAKDVVEAIATLPEGEDLAYYEFWRCQDIMSGRSFIWDRRQGEAPKTGSSQTVPHYRIDLAPGLNYFDQFVHKGESTSLVSDGWANYYYNDAACHKTLKGIRDRVGSDWTTEVTRVPYHGQSPALIAKFYSKTASEVGFGLALVGQGTVQQIPDVLLEMQRGFSFFNVADSYCEGRIRFGSNCRGEVWQYP